MGFGHVARVEAILDAWLELGGTATLMGRGITGAPRQRLSAAGARFVDLQGEHDLEALLELASKAAGVVLDGYDFEDSYRALVREVAPLLFIDDFGGSPSADIVLNQNVGFSPEKYQPQPGTQLLVGHELVLLRRELRQLRAHRGSHSEGDALLLTFGGSDPARLSLPVTRALLAGGPPELGLRLIAGAGILGEDGADLARLAADHEQLTVLQDVRRFAAALQGARCALTASGSTVWELLATGVVPLAVIVADNQRPVAEGLAEHVDPSLNLGWYEGLDAGELAARGLELWRDQPRLSELRRRGQALIDGQGVCRAIEALLDVGSSRP